MSDHLAHPPTYLEGTVVAFHMSVYVSLTDGKSLVTASSYKETDHTEDLEFHDFDAIECSAVAVQDVAEHSAGHLLRQLAALLQADQPWRHIHPFITLPSNRPGTLF